jgi:hypothetical protein
MRQLAGTTKLAPNFFGTFEVVRSIKDISYELDLPAAMSKIHPVFHVQYLKKVGTDKLQPNPIIPPLPALNPEEDGYDVDCILSHRYRYGKPRFLVKWTNYPGEDSWVPPDDVGTSLIDEYMKTNKWRNSPFKVKYLKRQCVKVRIFE